MWSAYLNVAVVMAKQACGACSVCMQFMNHFKGDSFVTSLSLKNLKLAKK
jgi:cytidine deaminase